ncbi:hypothetical protein [Streptomyces botrytidirepellens]|uniref:Uncharacterized protein n=1 Tax=Streptomyces botrytidirepellens TaxID=2486417 RepID=A0A3M8V7K2_9ACTN|nr:hypothetical protein [Streptomyces botrytidirepellens]RNG13019.1 hypothetical protein EEJ42_31745 [Streptomyces botrytidirepellens]
MPTHTQPDSITTVTAGCSHPGGPARPSTGRGGSYTVTAFVNVDPDCYDGYQEGHMVAEVTTSAGAPLCLVFDTGTVDRAQEAALVAYDVGNRQGSDDRGQYWPADVRSLSKGDVLAVTSPEGTTTYLSVDSLGCSEIPRPSAYTVLASVPSATCRRAFQWQPDDPTATGPLIGALLCDNADFRHPSGPGDTINLLLHTRGADLLARPGDWLVRAYGAIWHVISADTLATRRISAPATPARARGPRDR